MEKIKEKLQSLVNQIEIIRSKYKNDSELSSLLFEIQMSVFKCLDEDPEKGFEIKVEDGDLCIYKFGKLKYSTNNKEETSKPYKVEEIGVFGGVKYQNAVNYDFVCPYSGEGFMEGDMSFSTLSYKRWEHSTPAIITDTKLRMFKNHPVLTERLAYFHTKEDAIKWNKDKFGEKETPKTKTAEQLQKEVDEQINNNLNKQIKESLKIDGQYSIELVINKILELENKLKNTANEKPKYGFDLGSTEQVLNGIMERIIELENKLNKLCENQPK